MSELHLAAGELMDALHVWDSAGFHAAGTPARPLGPYEKTGGVIAGIRKNYQSSTFRHLAAHEDQRLGAAKLSGLPPGPVDFWDFVPVSWRMRGLNIVAIAAYLTSCGGAVGPNQTKLATLAGFILALNASDIWVVAGDMNMPPEQLARSGWLEQVQGVIVVPHNTDHTCTAGTDPRLLDYAIIAKGTEVFFPDLHAVDDGIWTSHFGLDLAINADPLVSVRWSLQLPVPFPHPPRDKRAPDPKSKASRRKLEALSKRSAQAEAAAEDRRRQLESSRHLKALAIEAAREGKPPPESLIFPPAAQRALFDSLEPESEYQMDAQAEEEQEHDPHAEGPADLLCEDAFLGHALDTAASGPPAQPEEEPPFEAPIPPSSGALPKACHNALWNSVTMPKKSEFYPPSFILESTAFQCTRPDALRLGKDFGSWAARMEAFFCELYQIDPLSRKRYQGRAGVQELKLGAPPAPPAGAITSGDTWWAAIASKLDVLARMKTGSASAAKISTHTERIVLCAAGIPADSAPKLSPAYHSQWKHALLSVGSLSPPALRELADAAKVNKTLAAREAMRASLAACVAWFDKSAEAGYGDVHRAAKPKVFVPAEFIIQRNGTTSISKNQAEFLAEKRVAWASKWDHEGVHDPELLRILEGFRVEAVEVPRDPLDVPDLDVALSYEAEKKSRGLVQVAPSDLSRLPSDGKQQLIDIINSAERAAAWPWQFLAVAVALIPKKEGDRGLGILPWLTRLWSRMRSNGLNEWIDQTADPWDDAVAGSSALTQALRRAFFDEAATANRVCAASNLWDVKEFFDSLDMLKILQAAKDYGFPPVELVLLFLEHLAPRLLRIRGAYAAPIQPHRSAVAGCRGAQQFARILLKRILFHVHSTFHPLVISKSWVDDVNQRAEASRAAVVKACVSAGEAFAQGIQDLGLVVADKSRVISTVVGVAEDIAAQLSAKGFPIKAADTCPDLGIDRGRRVSAQKPAAFKRLVSAAAKNRKFAGLIRATKKWTSAKQLFCGGVQPQAAYHAQVHGLPPSRILALRRGAGAMLSHSNRGRCLTTRLAIEMGDKDPGVSVPLSLLTAWFAYLVTCPEDRARILAVWPRIAKTLRHPKTRWRHIRGPAAAVIATLLDAGWSAPSADVWEQPDGTTWHFSTEFMAADFPDFSDVKAAFAADLKKQLWAAASKFRNGVGLEHGADLRPTVNHLHNLAKHGRYELHGAVLCCATASSWPNARIAEEYPSAESLCQRCLRAPETELHRHWECPANDDIKACKRSSYLIPRAKTKAAVCPAFWLRGIVPADWTAVAPPCLDADPCDDCMDGLPDRVGSPTNRIWLFGDGSGGVNTQDPRLRRCGWAWVELQVEANSPVKRLHRVRCAPLHGRRETVNRAELLALVDGIRSTQGSLSFVSDSAYVVNGFQKLKAPAKKFNPRSNRDLWSALKASVSNRDVAVLKIESHLDCQHPDVINGTYPLAWIFGNDTADELAGEAAADAQIPATRVEAVKWVDALAATVRTRLAATLQDAAAKEPRRHAPPRPAKKRAPVSAGRRSALEAALASTQHSPVADAAGAYSCRACGTAAHLSDAAPWLRTPCVTPKALPFCAVAAAPPAGAEVRLGNAVIHRSHQPVFFAEQRTWACTTCGRSAVNFMRELAEICKGKEGCSAKGKLNLSRLKRGLMIGDSAAAKEFNLARTSVGKRQRPPPRPAAAAAVTAKPHARGTKHPRDQPPLSDAMAALRARICEKETLAASPACAAALPDPCLASSSAHGATSSTTRFRANSRGEFCPESVDISANSLAASSSCAAVELPPRSRFDRLRAAFAAPEYTAPAAARCATPLQLGSSSSSNYARNLAGQWTVSSSPVLNAVPAPAASASPVAADQIEKNRLAAISKRAARLDREAVAASSVRYLSRATASYEAAVRNDVLAAAVPLVDENSEDEWGFLVPEGPLPAASEHSSEAEEFHSCADEDEESAVEALEAVAGAVPEEWQAAYASWRSLENLADLVDMHSDGLPVIWPPGLNYVLAVRALQLRRSGASGDLPE